jgi:hypothetical protein
MSLFRGIKDTSSQGSGDYLGTGVHRLALVTFTTKVTRKKMDAVIARVEVLESSNPKYAKGAKASIFFTAKPDTNWLGDVKNLALALLGSKFGEAVGEDAVDEEVMDAMTAGDGTKMAGVEFKCQAFEVPTKRGGVFTKYANEPIFS